MRWIAKISANTQERARLSDSRRTRKRTIRDVWEHRYRRMRQHRSSSVLLRFDQGGVDPRRLEVRQREVIGNHGRLSMGDRSGEECPHDSYENFLHESSAGGQIERERIARILPADFSMSLRAFESRTSTHVNSRPEPCELARNSEPERLSFQTAAPTHRLHLTGQQNSDRGNT